MLVKDVYLVTQRKPLEAVVPHRWMRWLLRMVFKYYGFACRDADGKSYASIEYRGVFDNEADARWAANCDGGAVKPIPFNAALPEQTVTYKAGDVPMSEASSFYRRGVLLPFVAVDRSDVAGLAMLEAKIEQTLRRTDLKCADQRSA